MRVARICGLHLPITGECLVVAPPMAAANMGPRVLWLRAVTWSLCSGNVPVGFRLVSEVQAVAADSDYRLYNNWSSVSQVNHAEPVLLCRKAKGDSFGQ